ncbi:hypothetical protein [Rugamonas rubra]|jgi:hypothetical protein|uniref:Uncharacterized protein n=1 Tax=Rugamonas rubra TaxID=758825 RepID=A0A1I4QET4_9BURK|nr:hypothetical protein [Rugamonas rubra]SFM38235.1 hypothetical protein SAMN02982985_03861 [Rugamonas rubra]
MTTEKTTSRYLNGVLVVTTEWTAGEWTFWKFDGLDEALMQPYKGMSPAEVLRLIDEKNRKILEENKEMVAQFVV